MSWRTIYGIAADHRVWLKADGERMAVQCQCCGKQWWVRHNEKRRLPRCWWLCQKGCNNPLN